MCAHQNRHGEGGRLYRYGHFQIVTSDSIIPSAATALQSAAAKATTGSATQDSIHLFEGDAKLLTENSDML
jgi:hypothetical protein